MTAAETYAARAAAIRGQIGRLSELLDAHAAEFHAEHRPAKRGERRDVIGYTGGGSVDWSYPGDLGRVAELLSEAVAFLSGEEP